MKGKSKLNNAWIAVLLLALLVGFGPIPSLAPTAAADVGQAGVLPAAQRAALKPVLPATDLVPAEVPPAAVEDGWWATVQENIRRSEYHVTWQEQTYLDDVSAAYQAPNRAENLRTYFGPDGPILIPRVWAEETAVPPWRWEASLVAWGRAGSLQPVAQGDLVKLDLLLGGDLHPEMVLAGAEIDFPAPEGAGGLRYRGLEAVDASGALLPAWLALQGPTLSILVDDAEATYPIEVHPTITGLPASHDWALTFGTAGAEFSTSVATAGDVDGDGYSDVIVGAPNFDGGQPEEGAAFVYYGSAGGLYDFADWIESIDQEGAHYGHSVATAGDVNGDRYADVIVGAPDYTLGQDGEGGTWVYHGSATGLSHDVSTHDEGNQAGAAFGYSVATAGDVNGDGYADVIVGHCCTTLARARRAEPGSGTAPPMGSVNYTTGGRRATT